MKLVVCFPGIGYHCDKPLLYYSRKLAACAGYDHTLLLQYTYHKDGLRGSPAALREAFDTLYAQAETQLSAVDWPQYDDVLFLSKSIGTAVSAAFAQRHGIPFAAGVLHENDMDFPVARALACEIVSEQPYQPIGDAAQNRARALMHACRCVYAPLRTFGPMNEGNRLLIAEASENGWLVSAISPKKPDAT